MSHGSSILGPRHHQESASRWYLGELEDLVVQQEWAHGACHKSHAEVATRMHPAAISEYNGTSSRLSTRVQHIIASLESEGVRFNAFVTTRASSSAPSHNGAPHFAVQQNMRLNIMFASKETGQSMQFCERNTCMRAPYKRPQTRLARSGRKLPSHTECSRAKHSAKWSFPEILGFNFKCRCGVCHPTLASKELLRSSA